MTIELGMAKLAVMHDDPGDALVTMLLMTTTLSQATDLLAMLMMPASTRASLLQVVGMSATERPREEQMERWRHSELGQGSLQRGCGKTLSATSKRSLAELAHGHRGAGWNTPRLP